MDGRYLAIIVAVIVIAGFLDSKPWNCPRAKEWRRQRRIRRFQLEMASHGIVWPIDPTAAE